MAQVNDIGIDLGTSNVLIYMKGKGIVLREPAVVAIERESKKVLAVGNDAYRMIGRTPNNVLAVRPLRQGTVADFELTSTMLRYFVGNVVGRRMFSRPRAVISVPSGVNEVEKRSIISIMFDAGMRRTQLLDRPVAAALGVGLPFQEAYGTMIVDMGAGVTDIAVLSMGEVVVSSCVPIGGDYFDDAIIRYLRKKHNLLIGERTAEEIKVNIGCAIPMASEITMDVTGRNLISGMPKTQAVTSADIFEALKDPISELIESIQAVIERTPPQLASDIFEDGIVFSGGAAALNGLSEAIYGALKIPCGVADDPQTSVVMGCGRALEDLAGMKHLLGDGRRGWNR
ncbi:MAG: rod shape-determining protein [Clostridia bacterium]|nr:rod shape-determining protein [Clostridia bacterium]MBQ7865767.1 rod shape-determining protein [Clostridia bacterium]